MLTKKERLVNVLGGLNSDVVKLVTVTEQEALKKSRVTGFSTPHDLTTIKKYAVREHQFVGVNYEDMIKKLRFKEASLVAKVKKFIFGDKFKSQGTYVTPVTKNHAVFEHVKTHKQYLRSLSAIDAPVHAKYYDIVGRDITNDWKQLQEEFFTLSRSGKSQGLENPIRVNNTSLSNVKYIELERTGEVLYNELSNYTLKKLGLR